jgi:hypothetical protein
MAAGGNCVAAKRGGAQPEAEVRSQTGLPRPVNSMRWLRGASVRNKGEACRESGESRTAQGLSMLERDPRSHGWSENALKGSGMTIRDRRGRLPRAGLRALIVAMKPGNAGGAKEGERAMNSSPENPPPPVPVRAQQGGEAGIRIPTVRDRTLADGAANGD